MRVENSRGIDCFRTAVLIRATGALAFMEAPNASVDAVFRDCPELAPYLPQPATALSWQTTVRCVNSAHIMVRTLTLLQQPGQGLGPTVPDPAVVGEEPLSGGGKGDSE